MELETAVQEVVEEATTPRRATEADYKQKTVRDYGNGSIRDWIANAQTPDELEEIRQIVQALAARGRISPGSLSKISAAGMAKQQELAGRLTEAVPGAPGMRRTPGGLIVPR